MRCFETRNRYARRQQLPARPFRKTNFCLRVGHLEFTSISASSLRNMLTRRSTMPVFRPMLQTITFHCVLLLIRAMRCRLRNRTSIKTKQKSKKKKSSQSWKMSWLRGYRSVWCNDSNNLCILDVSLRAQSCVGQWTLLEATWCFFAI